MNVIPAGEGNVLFAAMKRDFSVCCTLPRVRVKGWGLMNH